MYFKYYIKYVGILSTRSPGAGPEDLALTTTTTPDWTSDNVQLLRPRHLSHAKVDLSPGIELHPQCLEE